MKTRYVFTVAVIICLGLIFVLTGVLRPFGAAVRWATKPGIEVLARASERLRGLLGRSSASEAALRDIEARIAREGVDRVRLGALEEENRALRTQLHFLETSGYESIGARVISRDLQNGRMHFLLDRGTQDRVEVGQAVVTEEGVFVGKILNVKERISILEVFTDPDARTATSASTRPHLVGVVEGRGNGAALLTYIPPSEDVKKDDILVTSGTEEKVPGNLPIGMINRVNGKSTDPFLTAAIEPLVGLNRLAMLSILQPRK